MVVEVVEDVVLVEVVDVVLDDVVDVVLDEVVDVVLDEVEDVVLDDVVDVVLEVVDEVVDEVVEEVVDDVVDDVVEEDVVDDVVEAVVTKLGHVPRLQVDVTMTGPSQSLPPFCGAGFVQDRDRVKRPVPQVTEQDPVTQGVKPPSTTGKKPFLERLLNDYCSNK